MFPQTNVWRMNQRGERGEQGGKNFGASTIGPARSPIRALWLPDCPSAPARANGAFEKQRTLPAKTAFAGVGPTKDGLERFRLSWALGRK